MQRSKSNGANRIPSDDKAHPGLLDRIPDEEWKELERRAGILRSLGSGPVQRAAAERAARALGVHWVTVYRWHKRLLEADLITALLDRGRGFHGSRLTPEQEQLVAEAIAAALARSTPLREVDLYEDVRERCNKAGLACPARRSVTRRWQRAKELLEGRERDAPGHYHVSRPLDVVQVDHTLCDVMLVDDLYRQPIGRPYLTVALDVATRCVLAAIVTFRAPSATTVALCVTRIVSKKDEWLRSLDLSIVWPMHGLPRSLHLDNAPEFHSKALSRGCAQFGIELIYRPPGQPHFGGHIERALGTLMSRLKSLPGATGSSTKERKGRRPEKTAVISLAEYERWLAIEIGERYHHREHKGLRAATPYAAWIARPPAAIAAEKNAFLSWAFLPAKPRMVRSDGVHFNNIRYWHPIFAQWAVRKADVLVHYDPRDLSRLFVCCDNDWLEVCYADLRHPPVSLWESEAAARYLRGLGRGPVSEARLFAAIREQREIVRKAATSTRRARTEEARARERNELTPAPVEPVDHRPDPRPSPPEDPESEYTGEIW